MSVEDLRSRAETAIRVTRREVSGFATHDVQHIVHELQVHQVELETQNEALRVAQGEIERSREEYQELFDCAPVGYLLVNTASELVRANHVALTLLNVPRHRALGCRLHAFVAPADQLILEGHISHARLYGRTSCELRLRAGADVSCHVRLDISVVPSSAHECLVVLTDISERKRNLLALEQLNQELEARVAARTDELATRNRQLEEEIETRVRSDTDRRELELRLREAKRFESLGLLAAGIAHDFNNLLVSVTGNAELLLLAPGLSPDAREPLTLIRRAGQHASDLTRQLLVFAGRGQLNMAAVDLPAVVAENLELLRTRLPAGVQLSTQVTVDLPFIEADRGQVNQVVMNLVTNAIEALEGAGAVKVHTWLENHDSDSLATFQHSSAAAPGSFVVLQVQDSGRGIPAATLARIFDPFFSTKFTGRGLGLASVLGIVQSHHGALRVRTQPGAGTSFEIAFPLATQRSESERPRLAPEATWKGSGRVLLVDDDDAVRRVVAKMLTWLGFEVTAANGGELGLELYRNGEPPFRLVVLDWIMPGFSGERVLKKLRELNPELPVILISGYSTEDLAAYDERVVCVQKPMTLAQMRTAVSSLLGDEPNVQLQ